MKGYVAISTHTTTRAYELDVAIGDRFVAYREAICGALKTQSVETHDLGYIPFHTVTDQ